jgi:hypothetical protein
MGVATMSSLLNEGHVMNGISLAALLGAASWFGSKLLSEDDRDHDDHSRDEAPLPAESPEERASRNNEFLWPSGPMFQ